MEDHKMTHYSQNNEQEAILEAVKDLPTGRFLDIGAYDGETFSNTLALAELGWRGVYVEPGATAFKKLAEFWEGKVGRDKMTLIHALVGLESRDLVDFWDCGDLYSTTEKENRERFQHTAHFSEAKILMPQIGISELLQKFEPFDVVSIDTEGTSVALFTRMLYLCFFPRVICVEHDGCNLIASFYGYREVLRTSENSVFVRG
jgi:FkbM family methyltransferase